MIGRLFRGCFILIGLGVGLALAAITQGNVAHLRLVMQDQTPNWAANMTPESTLIEGQTRDAQTGFVLGWAFQSLSLSGAHYAGVARGQGHALRGDVLVPWLAKPADITNISGQLDLAQLYPDQGITGRLEVVDMNAQIDLQTRQAQSLVGQGILQNVTFDAAPLGEGVVRLMPVDLGQWQGTLSLSSQSVGATLSGSGTFDQTQAQIAGELLESPDMPDRWMRWFNTNLSRTPKGWALDQSVDLKVPLGGP